jgi:hypothetical protein
MLDLAIIGLVFVALIAIYLFFKAIELLSKFLIVVAVSAVFPIIAVKIFNVGWNLSADLVASFVILGALGFVIYYGLAVLELFLKPIIKSFGFFKKKKKGKDKVEKGKEN